MTQEQYNRAVEIEKRLIELKAVKYEIGDTSSHLLSYCNSDYNPCAKWNMRTISDILDRHDKMIREEIDNEIEKLKKKIEEL